MNAKTPWLDYRERGSHGATRFMKWLALRCGRRVARLLLVPICGYFLAFSPRARTTSRQYLALAHGRAPRFTDLWRHYFTFATTLLDPALRTRIIVPGEVDTMLRISECLARGELVGLLGDRCAGSEKAVMCRFFGREAAFPQGPLLLAHSLRVPVMLLAGLYEGGRRYVIYVEPFCDEPAGDRAGRAAWIGEWAQRYAERLEHFCRTAPYNWFNFYAFWSRSPR